MSTPPIWKQTRVDRVATVNARIGWKALTASEYQADGYAFLATPNIKAESIDFENVNYINEHRYEESPELKLQPGDVLLAKDGNTLGITNVVRSLPRPATVNGSIAVLRAYDIEPRFLRYSLASGPTQGIIDAIKGGMGVPHLFQWDIKRLPLTLPPPDEQRRIADFLDAEAARIDLLVRQRTRQCDVLDELAPSTIDDTIQQMQKFRIVRLGYLAMVQTGVTVDGNRQQDGDIVTLPYLRVANVQAGYLDLDDIAEITVSRRAAAASRLRPGDVLMTEGGDLDKLGRGTVWHGEIEGCLHQNHVFAVRPDVDFLTPDYLALLTQAPTARKYFESTGSKTTNLASTSSSKIRDFRIPLPDISAQRALVKEIDARLKWISDFEDQLSRQISRLAERRLALITAAVNGQIDVTTARGVSLPGGVGG